MTTAEIMAHLRELGPQDPAVIFTFLAEEVYGATIAGGSNLRDAGDFAAWLRELAELSLSGSAKIRDFPSRTEVPSPAGCRTRPAVIRKPQERWDDTCPRCGHVHQGVIECGEPLGGGRTCRCELPVPA